MKYIISGTDREGSNSLKISKIIQEIYKSLEEDVEIIDLKQVGPLLLKGPFYGDKAQPPLREYLEKVLNSEGLIMVVPEYNGSMPGILKYFIDHLKFPDAFEFKPVCFVGLGGMFGGLRPVEHLQQVFGYRNAFIYPIRAFSINVWNQMDGDQLKDTKLLELLNKQAVGFQQYVSALKSHNLIGKK